MPHKQKIFIGVLVVLILALAVVAVVRSKVTIDEPETGKYDEFAMCLKDKGAVFYGAFWCPHCRAQKKMFGASEKLLNYVECSTPDAKGTTAICQEKNITGYPTWEFADGTRLNGEIPLAQLAEKTECVLPVE